MRKLFHRLLVIAIIVILSLLIASCAPGEFLSGASGADATESPATEAPVVEAPPTEPPVVEIPPTEAPGLTIHINPTKNGGYISTTESTIPSMGVGKYEITFPQKIKIGDTKIIRLVIVLNSQETGESHAIQDSSQIQIIQGTIDVYPYMRVELKSSEAVDIVSDGYSDKTMLSSSPVVEWNWWVTPNKSGKQEVILSIFLPIPNEPIVQLNPIRLEFFVEELPATQTPTTPTQSIAATTFKFTIEKFDVLAPVVGSIIVALIVLAGNRQKTRKEKEEQLEREQKNEKIKKVIMDTSKATSAKSNKSNKKK
jgi:hypothetical protein